MAKPKPSTSPVDIDTELRELIADQKTDKGSTEWKAGRSLPEAPRAPSIGSEPEGDEAEPETDLLAALDGFLEEGDVERADRLVQAGAATATQFQEAVARSHHGRKLQLFLSAARHAFASHSRRASNDTPAAQVAIVLAGVFDAYSSGATKRLAEMAADRKFQPKRTKPPRGLLPGHATHMMADLLADGDGVLLFQAPELVDMLVPELRTYFPALRGTVDPAVTREIVVRVLDDVRQRYQHESDENIATWRTAWEAAMPLYVRPRLRPDGKEPALLEDERRQIARTALRTIFRELGATSEQADDATASLQQAAQRARNA